LHALFHALSFWRPAGSVIAVTFALAAGNGSGVRADEFIAPDAPPVQAADFRAWSATRDRAPVDGKLVWQGPRGELPARGTHLFLMPEDDYSVWFAKLATDNALASRDAAVPLDDRARPSLLSAIANRYGVFSFPSVPSGPYVLFAVLNVKIGPATPVERVERGWDGSGHGADVTVPSVDIPQGHIESFRYLYAYALRGEQRPWHLGVVRPNAQMHDGRPAAQR
jgi:hypothetical protein